MKSEPKKESFEHEVAAMSALATALTQPITTFFTYPVLSVGELPGVTVVSTSELDNPNANA